MTTCERCEELGIDPGERWGVPRPVELSAVGHERRREAVGDHLDASPSETVRRHAATFRRVRLARQAADTAARNAHAQLSDESSDELGEISPATTQWAATSDEMPPRIENLAKSAEANGWVVRRVASRGKADAVSLRCRRVEEDGTVALVGYWRAATPSPPMKWEWKWAFGLATEPGRGTRLVGARQVRALLTSPMIDPPILHSIE